MSAPEQFRRGGEPCEGDPFCEAFSMGLHWHVGATVLPDEEGEQYGPLDAMVRMSPVPGVTTLAWVERYGHVVLTRYVASLGVHADGGLEEHATIMGETQFATEAAAVREVAYRVAALTQRGFRQVAD